VIRIRTADAVSVFERERQELLRSRRQRNNERDGADLPCSHPVRPDVRPQHRTRWRHFRLKHMYNPRRRAVYQVSASRAERIAQGGKRVTSCATPRKVEIANALISLRTRLTLPRCSRVTSHAEVIPINSTAPLLPACRQLTKLDSGVVSVMASLRQLSLATCPQHRKSSCSATGYS